MNTAMLRRRAAVGTWSTALSMIVLLLAGGCAGHAARVTAQTPVRAAAPAMTDAGSPPPDVLMLRTDERTRLRALWRAGDVRTLGRELTVLIHAVPAAALDAADAPFLRGERAAAFHAYERPQFRDVVVMTIGGWYEQIATTLRGASLAPRDRVTAALFVGDAEAACGRFGEARAAWAQSLDEGVVPAQPHGYYPEWTSSLRRLIAYRHAPDRSRNDVFCATAEMNEAAARRYRRDLERNYALIAVAWRRLARGDAHAALRTFDAAMPFWERNKSNGWGYVDDVRGTIIAALLAREDTRAARALRAMHADTGGLLRGDALVFEGRWNEAFAQYRDSTAHGPMAEGIDPVIAAGAEAARAGDLRKAIAAWSAQPSGGGAADLGDEQRALVGVARARLGDWNGAVDAWLDASRMGRAVPEWQSLWTGNVIALDMLYHFRSRYARGDRMYHLRVDPGPRA